MKPAKGPDTISTSSPGDRWGGGAQDARFVRHGQQAFHQAKWHDCRVPGRSAQQAADTVGCVYRTPVKSRFRLPDEGIAGKERLEFAYRPPPPSNGLPQLWHGDIEALPSKVHARAFVLPWLDLCDKPARKSAVFLTPIRHVRASKKYKTRTGVPPVRVMTSYVVTCSDWQSPRLVSWSHSWHSWSSPRRPPRPSRSGCRRRRRPAQAPQSRHRKRAGSTALS